MYLADNTATGLIMIVGMLLCSPIAASAATLGSFLGILTGVAVGAGPFFFPGLVLLAARGAGSRLAKGVRRFRDLALGMLVPAVG